jgi:hypothetical protein
MAANPSNRIKRIGAAVLKVLTKHSIKAVPIVGPYLEVGYDLVEAVSRELASEDLSLAAGPVSNTEILEALRQVTPEETVAIVDTELKTAESRRLLAGLDLDDQAKFRDRLIRLPTEFESVLAEVEASQRKRRSEKEARESEESNRLHLELRAQLKERLLAEDVTGAWRIADRILRLNPNDSEIWAVKRSLDSKLYITYRELCGRIAFFSFVVAYVLGIFDTIRQNSLFGCFSFVLWGPLGLGVMVCLHMMAFGHTFYRYPSYKYIVTAKDPYDNFVDGQRVNQTETYVKLALYGMVALGMACLAVVGVVMTVRGVSGR